MTDAPASLTPVLALDYDDDMFLWATDEVKEPLTAALERSRRKNGTQKRAAAWRDLDPFLFMAEYLVWKATPPAWRPADWPKSEQDFCQRLGGRVTMLLWYRRSCNFDRLVKRAKRFQPGAQERIMDARNVAHQMVLRQPEVDPRFADARWFSELARVEGISRGTPLLQINSTSNVLQFDARDAEASISDALAYFHGKGQVLPPNTRVETRMPTAVPQEVPRGKER